MAPLPSSPLLRKGCLLHAPDMYMDKIAVGPRAKGCINIDDPVSVNLERVAKAMHRNINDLVVVALIVPVIAKIIEEVRAAGARIRLISDGDVNPIIETGLEGSGGPYVHRTGRRSGRRTGCLRPEMPGWRYAGPSGSGK